MICQPLDAPHRTSMYDAAAALRHWLSELLLPGLGLDQLSPTRPRGSPLLLLLLWRQPLVTSLKSGYQRVCQQC